MAQGHSSSDTTSGAPTTHTTATTTEHTETTTKAPASTTSSSSGTFDPFSDWTVPLGPSSTSSTATPTSVAATAPTATLSSSAQDSASGPSTGAKIGIGILVGFLILGILAVLSFWFVRRRWRLKNSGAHPGDYAAGGGLRRQWSLYEATSQDDHDDRDVERGRRDVLRDGEIGLYDPAPGNTRPTKTRRSSSASLHGFESSEARAARVARQRTSIGLDHEPEPYTLFGASTTSLGLYRDEDPYADQGPKAPPGLGKGKGREDGAVMEMGQIGSGSATKPDHSRQNTTSSTSSDASKYSRRQSLLDDSSRYPSVSSASSGRRMSRASDPFSDKSPPPPQETLPKILAPPPPGAMKNSNPFKS